MIAIGAALLLGAGALAADFQPPWALVDQPNRMVFTAEGGTNACALVTVPSRTGAEVGRNTAFAACNAEGNILAHCVVHSDSTGVDLLVGIGAETGRLDYAVYYGGSNRDIGRLDAVKRDAMPVCIEVFKPAGNNVPTAWPKMFYLFSQAGPQKQVLHVANFGTLELPNAAPAEGKHHDRSIAHLKSFVLCPDGGRYRFCVELPGCRLHSCGWGTGGGMAR